MTGFLHIFPRVLACALVLTATSAAAAETPKPDLVAALKAPAFGAMTTAVQAFWGFPLGL